MLEQSLQGTQWPLVGWAKSQNATPFSTQDPGHVLPATGCSGTGSGLGLGSGLGALEASEALGVLGSGLGSGLGNSPTEHENWSCSVS